LLVLSGAFLFFSGPSHLSWRQMCAYSVPLHRCERLPRRLLVAVRTQGHGREPAHLAAALRKRHRRLLAALCGVTDYIRRATPGEGCLERVKHALVPEVAIVAPRRQPADPL
jgi:hypothetical protein